MLGTSRDLAEVHIAALLADAEQARLARSATRAPDRRTAARRWPSRWWRRLMGLPVGVVGSRPVEIAS
jgi:hypothetical protein